MAFKMRGNPFKKKDYKGRDVKTRKYITHDNKAAEYIELADDRAACKKKGGYWDSARKKCMQKMLEGVNIEG